MTDRNGQQAQAPSPRAQAVQAAAQAVQAHATTPDTATLHTMQNAVQDALNHGASPQDIRDARPAVTA